MTDRFDRFAARMRAENLPDIAIRTFEHYYRQLVAGETGFIPESAIQAVAELADMTDLGDAIASRGQAAFPQTVFIKLNGGLGTSMGLNKAKSLLPVKNGLTFLDIIARQARQAAVPLVLMNSFATRRDTLEALQAYPQLASQQTGLDFLQHKVPKVDQDSLAPAQWPPDPQLAWCPPGHGDLYTALVTSGMLGRLLDAGFRYAFVSNADNLGAVLEARILGYVVEKELPFLMEVADRTEADRKGGHLARRGDGRLILRESAQCPQEDLDAFQDISKHRFFNTNNLWIDLQALESVMQARENILGLPLIRNSKTVDPRDPTSPAVYQLETAMGAAIEIFPGAQALRVPRNRFAPVKTTSDLLVVRSDAYKLTNDYRVVPDLDRLERPPVVELDPDFYRLVDELDARFPAGPPSLVECRRFSLQGDFCFASRVRCKGQVNLVNRSDSQVFVEDPVLENASRTWP